MALFSLIPIPPDYTDNECYQSGALPGMSFLKRGPRHDVATTRLVVMVSP